jgi:hypothetical protein
MPQLATDTFVECTGYAASALVLATFCFSDPVRLRLFALLTNVAFIAFGYFGSIHPVMFLHIILMPINGFHLVKLLSPTRRLRDRPKLCRIAQHISPRTIREQRCDRLA